MGERGTAMSGHMAEVDYDRSCRSCHSLEFDNRVAEQAPHTDAATVLKFVQQKMATAAPGDDAALVKAETIVFRDKCALCHTVSGAEALPRAIATSFEAPTVAPSKQPDRFFSAAVFSHSAHGAVQCEECHTQALTSTDGKDLLLPGIKTCQRCHDGQSNPQGALPAGHAESGCSLCHTYHEGGRMHGDGTVPTFRIDELVRGR
jgi:ribosomal protein S27E